MTIACPDCGTLEEIPRLLRRDSAVCVRCQSDLEKTNGRSSSAALACSLATLLLLFPANVLPLLRVDVLGTHSQNITAAGVAQLWERGWILLAGLSALFIIVLPFLRFGLLSAVLTALKLDRRPSWLGSAFRWSIWLDWRRPRPGSPGRGRRCRQSEYRIRSLFMPSQWTASL